MSYLKVMYPEEFNGKEDGVHVQSVDVLYYVQVSSGFTRCTGYRVLLGVA